MGSSNKRGSCMLKLVSTRVMFPWNRVRCKQHAETAVGWPWGWGCSRNTGRERERKLFGLQLWQWSLGFASHHIQAYFTIGNWFIHSPLSSHIFLSLFSLSFPVVSCSWHPHHRRWNRRNHHAQHFTSQSYRHRRSSMERDKLKNSPLVTRTGNKVVYNFYLECDGIKTMRTCSLKCTLILNVPQHINYLHRNFFYFLLFTFASMYINFLHPLSRPS